MSSTQHLTVWRKAHELAVRIHETTAATEPSPHVDLAHRLRAVSIAIPLAIDNGAQSHTPGEFAALLEHAQVLARELEYLISLSQSVGVVAPAEGTRLLARLELVRRMTAGLLRVLERKSAARFARGKAEASALRSASRPGSAPTTTESPVPRGGANSRRRPSTRPSPSG